MRIGVLGGTFDPIHTGHLILGEAAHEGLALDSVIFVPAGDPWRKAGREIAPVADRVAMTRLAVEDNPHFSLSMLEAERAGPSYTDETLAALREPLGDDSELYFILGRDSLADLPFWKNPSGIIHLARLAVAERPGATAIETAELEARVPGITGRIVTFAMPSIGISSTDIRRRCRDGLSIRYFVPPAVEAYITGHRLYAAD
jgi:nicotinate-nucleotide adenylyltransferase